MIKIYVPIFIGISLLSCASPEEAIQKQACDLVKDHAKIAMTFRQNMDINESNDPLYRELGVLAYSSSKTAKVLKENDNTVLNNYIINMIYSSYDVPLYINKNDQKQAIKTFIKEQEDLCYKSLRFKTKKQ